MTKDSPEDLDFEISFYEGILKENPDFVNALVVLGDAYTKRGRFQEGLLVDQRLAHLKPDDPIVHYNLACSYSLLETPGAALDALTEALRLGYRDFSFMERDSDLISIRKEPRYQELIARYGRKRAEKEKKLK